MRRDLKPTRVRDLQGALASRKHSRKNGNHQVEVAVGLRLPDLDFCRHCELNMLCLSTGQISAVRALAEHRACVRDESWITFRYHGTPCLTADVINKRITDHGQYGRSVSTSSAIRKYLQAIAYEYPGMNLISDRIDALIKLFKKRPTPQDEGWVAV